jgi:signal peptidase II
VVIAVFLVRAVRRATDTLLVVALSLVLGGAIGNLLDRVTNAEGFLDGGVVDFIGVSRFPTFNIADSCITIGAILLIWWGWKRPEEPKSAAPHESTTE